MANMKISGIDVLLEKTSRLGQLVAQRGGEAVAAGTRVLYDEMQRRIPVDTGQTKRHMVMKEPVRTMDGYSCTVTYQGKRSDGTRYAEIAFVNEYGRSNMAARPFIRPTLENKREEAQRAMLETLMKEE